MVYCAISKRAELINRVNALLNVYTGHAAMQVNMESSLSLLSLGDDWYSGTRPSKTRSRQKPPYIIRHSLIITGVYRYIFLLYIESSSIDEGILFMVKYSPKYAYSRAFYSLRKWSRNALRCNCTFSSLWRHKRSHHEGIRSNYPASTCFFLYKSFHGQKRGQLDIAISRIFAFAI